MNLKPWVTNNYKAGLYKPPHTRVSSNEMEDRRSKVLCFWCNEKYTFGHKCPNRRLYSLILEPMEEEDEQEEGEEAIEHTYPDVLVDSGSTHNVLDIEVAKSIECLFQRIDKCKVMVANENKLSCDSICTKFRWFMQGQSFEGRVLLMPLKGCKLILGIEWLNSLGVVKWDFPKPRMEFCTQAKEIVLQS